MARRSRRKDDSIFGDIFELMILMPWWGGPLFAGLVYALIKWGITLIQMQVHPEPGTPAERVTSIVYSVLGDAIPRIAPLCAGLVILVWLIALLTKLSERKR